MRSRRRPATESHGHSRPELRQGRHLDGTVEAGEQLLCVDFRTRADRDGGSAAIGRFYATREGPFRTFTVMYTPSDSSDAGVEPAVARMLDSVRLAAPAP